MILGSLTPALLALTCLTGCAAHAPESRPVTPVAAGASENRTVSAPNLETQPEPVDVVVPSAEYPQGALEANFQGAVALKILIDETGRVREAKALNDPGHGLGDAAVRSALAHFRFSPGRFHGQPIATWWKFTVLYELPRR